MTTTSHAITGAFVATLVKQPLLAIPLAFISHFICDMIPHFELRWKFGSRKMWIRLFADGLIALAVAVFLVMNNAKNPFLLAVCGFAAMSPDLFWLYYGLRGRINKPQTYDPLSRFHARIQWYEKVPGLAVELPWDIMLIFLILRLQ